MGDCIYCGKPAGILRNKHPECEDQQRRLDGKQREGRNRILQEIDHAIRVSSNFGDLDSVIQRMEQSYGVSPSERNDLLVRGWENYVEDVLADGILEEDEEHRLATFGEHFALKQHDVNANVVERIAKAAVLRDVLNGQIPRRIGFAQVPVNLQKGEQIVWAFDDSEYLEDRTHRQYVGGSQGVSIRIMKGVYYRTGAFRGQSVDHTERTHIDTGVTVISNKNISFVGPRKGLRIPYSKILSFEPFSDGIGVMRDAANAKAQVFITGDGWFTYNLVTNLAQA